MPADPQPGDAYRQEYYPPGEALDQARVLRLDGSATVPYGSFTHLLVTSERSPYEPQTEQKYYAPGVGEVAERVVAGHHEVQARAGHPLVPSRRTAHPGSTGDEPASAQGHPVRAMLAARFAGDARVRVVRPGDPTESVNDRGESRGDLMPDVRRG